MQSPFEIAVIIPSMGSNLLTRAAHSAFQQSYSRPFQILIGIDDNQSDSALIKRLKAQCPKHITLTLIDPGYATRSDAGGTSPSLQAGSMRTILSYLANARYVAYLDEDAWWRPDHLEHGLRVIQNGNWCYSYRMFLDRVTGRPLCMDNFESIGTEGGMHARNNGGFIDPSCLILDKRVCEAVLPLWNKNIPGAARSGPDFQVSQALLRHFKGAPTRYATAYCPIRMDDIDKDERLRQIMQNRTKQGNPSLDNDAYLQDLHLAGLEEARKHLHSAIGREAVALSKSLKLDRPLTIYAATPDPQTTLPALLNAAHSKSVTLTLSSHIPEMMEDWQDKLAGQLPVHFSAAPWGNGQTETLYKTRHLGLSSLRKPDLVYVNWYNQFSEWMAVTSENPVNTVEISTLQGDQDLDGLFIGPQGNELDILKGVSNLDQCLMVEIQTPFDPLYENQSLFGECDAYLRAAGFALHRQYSPNTKTIAPMVLNNQTSHGINQIVSQKSVYIPNPAKIQDLSILAKKKLAFLCHYLHGSLDLSQRLCMLIDQEVEADAQKLLPSYSAFLKNLLKP